LSVQVYVQAKNCIVVGTFKASYDDYYTRKPLYYEPSPQSMHEECLKFANGMGATADDVALPAWLPWKGYGIL
jgi:hypothetical protein